MAENLSDEQTKQVEAIVQAVRSRISVPMDTRGFGGSHGGILLGAKVLDAIAAAASKAITEQLVESGPIQEATYWPERRDL